MQQPFPGPQISQQQQQPFPGPQISQQSPALPVSMAAQTPPTIGQSVPPQGTQLLEIIMVSTSQPVVYLPAWVRVSPSSERLTDKDHAAVYYKPASHADQRRGIGQPQMYAKACCSNFFIDISCQ